MPSTSERESIDIENAGKGVELEVNGRHIVEVAIRGDGSAGYTIKWREHPDSDWVTPGTENYSGSADYDDTVETGARDIRVECTTGSGTAGQSAEIVLSAGGG